jgi:hypothetical protein
MIFVRVLIEGRRAYCSVGDTLLCYDPHLGVHILRDAVTTAEPRSPRLWLGEVPDAGWRHTLDRSAAARSPRVSA